MVKHSSVSYGQYNMRGDAPSFLTESPLLQISAKERQLKTCGLPIPHATGMFPSPSSQLSYYKVEQASLAQFLN